MRFFDALRAEFLKVTTSRMWWVLLLVLVGYVAFTAGLLAVVFGGLGEKISASGGNVPLLPENLVPPVVYSIASSVGFVFPVIFGTLATTVEFRHQTLTPTFLATPRRGVVLAAKFVTLAVVGAVYGLSAILASVGIGASILAISGHDTGLGNGDTWLLLLRIVAVMAIWAVIGVGLGSLIPSQVAAIVIVLAFTQFLEPILRFVSSIVEWTSGILKFLPGAASDAFVGTSIFTSLGESSGAVEKTLLWWQGGLVLLGFAVLAGVVGYLTSWRKDVT